jgi:RND family efflux transporter MFP subunit
MTRFSAISIAAALVAAATGGAWYYRHANAAAAPEAAAPPASVQAQTAMVQRRAWPLTIDAYGEVAAGRPETLNFAQAGRLAMLGVVAGQRVRRGDVLAVLENDPNARAAYAQASSAVDFARREASRQRDLLALQLATQAQADGAARQLADAEIALAAQARLGGAGVTAKLTAPFDGVVLALAAAQGDRLAAGAAVLQLAAAGALRVLLSVDPAVIGQLKAGMPLTVSAGGGEGAVRSTIVTLQGVVDPKTQMSGAVAQLPADSGLAPGTRVTARIEAGRRDAWSVARSAVLNDEKGTYLYQVEGKAGAARARRVAVRKVAETPDQYAVDGPLDGALPVVVLGNYELQDGAAVRGAAR